MRRELPIWRGLPSGNLELPSGKGASRWERSSLVVRPRDLPSEREFYSFPAGKELLSGKGAS